MAITGSSTKRVEDPASTPENNLHVPAYVCCNRNICQVQIIAKVYNYPAYFLKMHRCVS